MSELNSKKWTCIVCENVVELAFEDEDDQNKTIAAWPNVVGGTFSIDFGYGSKYDSLNGMHESIINYQGCICDSCFEQKRKLVRKVQVTKSKEQWTMLDEF